MLLEEFSKTFDFAWFLDLLSHSDTALKMKRKIYVSPHVPDVSWAWAIKMGKYTFDGCPYLMSTFSLCYVVHKNSYVKYLQKHGHYSKIETEKLFKTWFSNKHWKNTLTSNLSWVGFRVKPPYSLIRLLFYFFFVIQEFTWDQIRLSLLHSRLGRLFS